MTIQLWPSPVYFVSEQIDELHNLGALRDSLLAQEIEKALQDEPLASIWVTRSTSEAVQ